MQEGNVDGFSNGQIFHSPVYVYRSAAFSTSSSCLILVCIVLCLHCARHFRLLSLCFVHICVCMSVFFNFLYFHFPLQFFISKRKTLLLLLSLYLFAKCRPLVLCVPRQYFWSIVARAYMIKCFTIGLVAILTFQPQQKSKVLRHAFKKTGFFFIH